MTAHALIRLQESLYNTPQLITPEAFNPILDYLSLRNAPEFVVAQNKEPTKRRTPTKYGNVGEILVDGSLTYKPVNMLCSDGGTSYQGILEDAQMLIDSGVKKLVTTHSSGGGQASHCFDTANQLREMCDAAGVQWFAYIDTVSASASLALDIAADEVIIHPDAQTGSIGCVLALLDTSKRNEMMGVKPVYISSTAGKTPFVEDGSFSKEFLQKMQEDVTRLGNQFAEHVSKFTGIPVDEILSLDAQMFHAEKALELGLVNKIMTHKQFLAYLETN